MDVPTTEHGVAELAVAGDYLYLLALYLTDGTTMPRLLRCEKRSCTETLTELYRSPAYGTLSQLAVIAAQIGVLEHPSFDESAIITCAAPDCTDFARIAGLRYQVGDPRFELGAVEWAQYDDDAVYRCSLPNCEPAPELVVAGIGARRILVSGDVRIFLERGRIWRQSGDPPVLEALELGPESRSLGQPSFDDRLLEDTGPGDKPLFLEDDWLYSTTDDGCGDDRHDCSVARWPLRGYGPREPIYSYGAPLGLAALYDGELAFRRRTGPGPSYDYASCRVEDCASTLRVLPGGSVGHLVSDSERLYWVTVTGETQVYSLPRLPAP